MASAMPRPVANPGLDSPNPLISSDRVEGTGVYRSNGDKIGTIQHLMIDKLSGKTAYAVMTFGGFLGIGEDSYPLPWSVLTYSPKLGGYEVNVTDDQLKGAPKYEDTLDWEDRDTNRKIYDHYRADPYWV